MNKKICVVGAGRFGKKHIQTLNEMGNLAAVVDTNHDCLQNIVSEYSQVKAYVNIEDSFQDSYDGYIVATPANTHFEIGSILLKNKKNVLIEKPLAILTSEAKTLIALSIEYDCKLMVGHLLLFNPAIKKIKELIELKRIGKVLYVYSTRLNLGTVRCEENVFYSFAPHDISVLNYLIGSTPIEISAEGGCFLQRNIYDTVWANFEYPGEIKAHVFVSWLYPRMERRLIIVGSRGTLYYDDASSEKYIYLYNKSIECENDVPIKRDKGMLLIGYDFSAPLRNELEYFISCLDSKVTIADGQSGYEVVRVLEEVTKQLANKNERETKGNEKS